MSTRDALERAIRCGGIHSPGRFWKTGDSCSRMASCKGGGSWSLPLRKPRRLNRWSARTSEYFETNRGWEEDWGLITVHVNRRALRDRASAWKPTLRIDIKIDIQYLNAFEIAW